MVSRIERLGTLRWFLRSVVSKKRQNSENTRAVPLTRQISLAVRGFFPEKHACYQLDKNDWRLYFSDLQMLRSSFVNQEYRVLLDDKQLCSDIVGQFATVPKSLVVIRNGRPHWLGAPANEVCSLPELIQQNGAVIAKPVTSNGGMGVQLLEFRGGDFLRNGAQIDASELNWGSLDHRDTLVTEHVRQGSFANGLYSGTVNTIRLLTMQDPETRLPFLADTFIRVGCARSAPVDNIASGGLMCNIDRETGRLSKAVAGYALDGPVRRIDRHPDSGVIFEDQVIPRWKSICEQAITLSGNLPMLPYIGWDVALLDEDIVIIEANSWSEIVIMQMGRPLLTNPRVRRFFEYHNVL